jgi:voltage-gated potassium channel
MHYFIIFLKHLTTLIQKEKIHKVVLLMIGVIVLGSLALVFFEEQVNFQDALWWSFVTVTTVGYGDISPITMGGRIVAITVMLFGIGILGVFTATIAGMFIEDRMRENKGMKPTDATGHFILCGWNFRGFNIIEELRADAKCGHTPIVLIADVPEKPLEQAQLYFIRGEITTDILSKANLAGAGTVIVLADDTLDAYAADAKTILTTMTIKHACPEVYTCVELLDPKNIEHCRMARADEIIVTGELSTNLLVQAALDHGISLMITELISNRYGNELFKIRIPTVWVGRPFFEMMCHMKKEHDILCLGIEDESGRNLISNPSNDYQLKENDRLIVISEDRPQMDALNF